MQKIVHSDFIHNSEKLETSLMTAGRGIDNKLRLIRTMEYYMEKKKLCLDGKKGSSQRYDPEKRN